MLRMRIYGILSVAGYILTGCAVTGNTPPPAGGGIQADGAESAGQPMVPGAEYVIGSRDNLDVYVWRHPDLSRVVPVRPDGKISTPLVEDMVASGKTATELARDIEEVLGEYIKSPKVTIIVTGFVGNTRDQIRVIGQAGQPQAIPFTANMTLLDVLVTLGGISEFAAPRRSRILRRGPEGTTEIPVRPDLLLETGEERYDLRMRPGDVLVIPESRF